MIYRFKFVDGTDMESVQDTVALAILAGGCLVGDAAMRLDSGYASSAEKRTVVLRATGDAECVLRIFLGFCSHEYGAGSFTVERLPDDAREQQGETT